MNYENLTDNELLVLAKNDTDALNFIVEKYKMFVKQLSRQYFLIGAEPEDLIQEGMIGLYSATQSYDEKKCGNFKNFAKICILRKLKTAIKIANRQKYKPLNNRVPILMEDENGEDFDVFQTSLFSPEELFEANEIHEKIKHLINTDLSVFEKKALKLYLQGLSYNEIALKLSSTSKSVENALGRARGKLAFNLV